jgi:hypothetical protein
LKGDVMEVYLKKKWGISKEAFSRLEPGTVVEWNTGHVGLVYKTTENGKGLMLLKGEPFCKVLPENYDLDCMRIAGKIAEMDLQLEDIRA